MKGNLNEISKDGGCTTNAELKNPQTYIFPDDLLASLSETDDDGPTWTCVRTRPRWEKKFSRWLRGQRVAHFLPILARWHVSHRKRRLTQAPLFPGYVFVHGLCTKRDFERSDCVVRLLRPNGPVETRRLHADVLSLWKTLMSGEVPVVVHELAEGELVEITSGPMEGVIGTYSRRAATGRLMIWVDMLGTGVETELSPPFTLRPINDKPERTNRV